MMIRTMREIKFQWTVKGGSTFPMEVREGFLEEVILELIATLLSGEKVMAGRVKGLYH